MPTRGRAQNLRDVLTHELVVVAGCHDPLSARISGASGADALFVSGGAVGRALFDRPNVPTWGAEEYFEYLRVVCRRSPVPVIVDGETGFDDPRAACRSAVRAGAAGIVIGDGGEGAELAPVEVMADLVPWCRRECEIVLVPRTDALTVSVEAASSRIREYCSAGAELVLALMNSVLDPTPADRRRRVIGELADAAGGRLALHSRTGDEFPAAAAVPAAVKAVFLTAVSLPAYGPDLTTRVRRLSFDDAGAVRPTDGLSTTTRA